MKIFTRKTWNERGSAGLFGIMGGEYVCPDGDTTETWAVHFFVRAGSREWGYHESWYDGPIRSFGLGPLLLAVWT